MNENPTNRTITIAAIVGMGLLVIGAGVVVACFRQHVLATVLITLGVGWIAWFSPSYRKHN